MSVLTVYKLGIVNYKKALELQLSLLNEIKHGEIGDTLLLLEHPPTFTVGRRGKPEHLLKKHEELNNSGIHFEIVGRGGDITYHGPGQLVGYPILDLNNHKCDIHLFLRNIEEVIINALGDFDISGERKRDYTGVWVGDEKIASIGIGEYGFILFLDDSALRNSGHQNDIDKRAVR
jgi:lipoyl(octanoyl) transferase